MSSSSTRFGAGAPRSIFLGWAALVVVAGYGYFHVKTNNTIKKRVYMEQSVGGGGVMASSSVADGNSTMDAEGRAKPPPPSISAPSRESTVQSPLQSLSAAFARQK